MVLRKLEKKGTSRYVCPVCGEALHFISGGAVQVVDGKLDMDNIHPKYECESCGVFYREVMGTGYYDTFPLLKEPKQVKKNTPSATGDLMPMQLKRDENGDCSCPRCGAGMEFVEGQPVRLVEGKPDMENVWDHFVCEHCQSVYRRIAGTDYFQWTEK
jgi:uncharacterized protein with PIN domain